MFNYEFLVRIFISYIFCSMKIVSGFIIACFIVILLWMYLILYAI